MGNPTRSEYRRWIEAVLMRAPREVMAQEGFRRRGIVFDRLAGGVKQVVRFDIVVRPRYALDSAQLVFNVDISVPSVDRIYAKSVKGMPDARVPYFMRTSGDLLKKRPGGLWLFADDRQAELLQGAITKTLSADVIPFLAERSSVADLASKCVDEIESVVRSADPLRGDIAIYVAALLSLIGSI